MLTYIVVSGVSFVAGGITVAALVCALEGKRTLFTCRTCASQMFSTARVPMHPWCHGEPMRMTTPAQRIHERRQRHMHEYYSEMCG